MTELYELRRVRLYEEPAGSYGVDHSGTPGDFLDLAIVHGSCAFDPGYQTQSPNTQQQSRVTYDPVIRGRNRPTLTLQVVLAGLGYTANSSNVGLEEDASALLRLLKIAMGGLLGGAAGSAVAGTPANAYTIDVTTGHGTRFTNKQMVGLIDSTGKVEQRRLLSKATDKLTFYHGGTFTPADTTAVLNGTMVYMTNNPDTSAQFILDGAEDDDKWVFRGGQVTSFSIDMPNDGFWTINVTFAGSGAERLASGSLGIADYAYYSPEFKTSKFLVSPYSASGGQTAEAPCAQARSFNFNIAYEMIECSSDPDGVARQFATRGEAPTAMFTVPYDDAWFDAADALDEVQISQQQGDDPGNTWAVGMTRGQVINCVPTGPTRSNVQVTVRPIPIANASGELQLSPVSLHHI